MGWDQLKEARRFNKALVRETKQLTETYLSLFMRKLAFDILRGVMEKTPVDTGRARGSWRLTVGRASDWQGLKKGPDDKKPDGAEIVPIQGSGGDAKVIERASAALAAMRPYQTIWITNNVPYILRLENGWSDQAPNGMVTLTLAEARTMLGDI